MKRLMLVLLFILVLALLAPVAWAASDPAPTVPTWSEFLVLLGSGAFIVPLLGFLKRLQPPIGPFFEANAIWLAPILSAFCPLIASALGERFPYVNEFLWLGIYGFIAYGASQLVYAVQKKTLRL